MIIIFSGFLLRIALIIYNIDINLLPGAEYDAGWFHLEGVRYRNYLDREELLGDYNWEYAVGWVYGAFLGSLYYFIGIDSWYVSSLLSCFVWFLSALVFRKIMLKIKYEKKYINLAIIIYTFLLPTSIVYTAITLREGYMLLFFNLFVLSIINIYYENDLRRIIFNTIVIISITCLLLALHKGNAYFIVIFVPLMIIYYFINKFAISKKTLIVLLIFMLFCLSFFDYGEVIFDSIKNYQLGHFSSTPDRAVYYTRDRIENIDYSLITLFIYVLNNFFSYFVEPTIYRIDNLKDAILFGENTIRLILFFLIIKKSLLKFDNKILFIVFLTIAILMEGIYAQGTVNWGTASRHHVPVMGIIILLAFFPSKKLR